LELNQNSFNENFAILQKNAEKLRNNTEMDIDALVPLVEASTKSYQICKARIEAVKAALSKHVGEN
jgi:exodeoxyribonuclease VII small subunit